MAASTYFAQVQQLYIAYFGRPADTTGQAFWAGIIDAAKGNIAEVQAGFSSSAESLALYGNKSNIDKVTAIYVNTFGRQPDAAGLAFWVNQLESGKMTQAQAAWTIQQSAGPIDAAVVQAKLVAAQAFTAQIDTAAEIQGYQGAAAADSARAFLATVTSTATGLTAVAGAATAVAAAVAVGGTPGSTFALTTGVDNFVGGANADTFNGYINNQAPTTSTLTAADVITGGAGVDTLAIIAEGTAAVSLPNATITGVENFSIRDVATGASVYNFANVEGEAKVTSNVSSNAVTFQNLGTNTVVAVQGNNSAQVGSVTFNMATATDAVNLVLNGGLQDTVAPGSTAVINTAGTATKATIASTGAANTVGAVTLAGAATNTITSLTIDAVSDLTATLVAADYAATAALTVTGTGKVNLGTVAGGFDGSSIDASANTGGLTVAATAALTSFKGSTGNDVLAGTGITSTAVIDAGAGIDSVAATLVNAGNSAVFKNFEQIELANATGTLDAALLTGSTITGVTINNGLAAGFALSNLVETAAGFNVGINAAAGANTTLGFTAASVVGTADVLNYNFAGTTGVIAGGAITSQGIEIINISSKGGVGATNSLTVVDNAAKSIVITGDHQLTLTVGAQSAVGTATASALTSIDGSAATGVLNINTVSPTAVTQSALTIKGGSAADVITVGTTTGATSVGATVTTGNGNDTVNVAAATVQTVTAPQFTTITDFAKGDAIQFAAGVTAFTATAVDVSSATTLLGALQLANSATANTVQWLTYGGDTYVVASAAATGGAGVALDATDVVVKLTGTLNLSGATDAAGLVTFA